MSTWKDSLRPASWRGIEFTVLNSEGLAGRRVALHEYPFRDEPWAEDLGRRTRQIAVRGFLVGDDVADQLEQINEAAEEEGSGELVHPIRGTLTVTLVALATAEAWDKGRVVQLNFDFVETGERQFPTSGADGAAEVAGAAGTLDQKAAEGAETGIFATLKRGYAGLKSILKTGQKYVNTARSLISSGLGAIRGIGGVTKFLGIGNFDRFINRLSGRNSAIGQLTKLTSGVSTGVSRFNAAKNGVATFGSKVTGLLGKL